MRTLFSVVFLIVVGATSVPLGRVAIHAQRKMGRSFSRDSLVETVRERFPFKMRFVELSGAVARLCGRRLCNKRLRYGSGVVGNLHWPGPLDDFRWQEALVRMVRLKSELAMDGFPFLYVMVPNKLDLEGHLYPSGWRGANRNREAGTFLERAREKGIEVLNLAPILVKTPKDVVRNYFRTDHHWKFRAALRASALVAGRLAVLLKEPHLANCSNLNPENWEWHVKRAFFIGSQGRRTGKLFSGADDFEYAYPKFRTQLSRTIPSRKFKVSGDFRKSETLLRCLKSGNEYLSRYAFYTGGDVDVQVHTNAKAPSRHRVMIVKDSFGNPLSAFLATVFRSVIQVDPRKLAPGVSVRDLANRYRPDIVVEVANPGLLLGQVDGLRYEELR